MASNYNVDNVLTVPPLHRCKTCSSVLKDPVLLLCGHRVCKEPCLSQLIANPSQAQCPVTSCGVDIDQSEVTDDVVLRQAITEKVYETENNVGNFNNMESRNIAYAHNRISFQDQFDNITGDLTRIKEDNEKIRERTKSLMTIMGRTGQTRIEQHRGLQAELRKHQYDILQNTSKIQNLQSEVSSYGRQVEMNTRQIETNTKEIEALRLQYRPCPKVIHPRNQPN